MSEVQNQRSENAEFLTVEEFKARLNKEGVKAEIVKNPNTGKLFLVIGSLRFKVQASIDPNKDIRVLIPDGDLDQACLINAKPNTDNVIFTL